jgi:Fe-S-cluster-containing hydrogenase component 2
MVPNRRLREVLDQAAKANRERERRRPTFEAEATVVRDPSVAGVRVPDSSGPLFADADFASDEVLEVQTGDVEIEFDDDDLLPQASVEPPPRTRVPQQTVHASRSARSKPSSLQPGLKPGKRLPIAFATTAHGSTMDGFAEDAETRVQRSAELDLPLVDSSILVEDPTRSEVRPALRPEDSDPDDGYPQVETLDRQTQTPDDKSVVRRIVKSVVARLPKAFQKAVEKSGVFPLPRSGALGLAGTPSHGVDMGAWREMRTAPIFDGLPNEALRDALVSGDAQVFRVGRDTLLPLDGAVGLVRSGQVALAQFTAEALAEERRASEALLNAVGKGDSAELKVDKKEKKRRQKVGPLIQVAQKNLATFEEGDVVETSVSAKGHQTLACYSVTPVVLIQISRARADLWKRVHPFMADRLRRAATAARARLDATVGAKAIVADFFIRHGLSVSMTLRVRKLDSCIECGACEKACEDRYGVKRLSLNGRILGALDFVDACHTCTDQRCVDPCNFDAIAFDPVRKEVLINEASCTGCTLCAVACPYDAIEMHDLEEKPLLKLRLHKAGALAFGDGTPRKAKLRRMASKCDHCAHYEDQACISACPTGALLEILPSDAVQQLPEHVKATARAGFDRTARIDINALNAPQHFSKKGLATLPELGRARAKRGRLALPFWWTLGLLALGLCAAEIALRKLLPHLSVAYFMMTRIDGMEPELALSRVDYRPGCGFAVDMGYTGVAILLSGMTYVWRRRLPFLRSTGSLQAWFSWHVLSGVIGPSFILLHSAAKLDNWVSLGFWSMVATVLSGLLGRYLTTQIPERASTAAVETLDVDRQLGRLRKAHPGVRVADGWFESYRRRIAAFERRLDRNSRDSRPTFGGAVRTLLWVLLDDLGRGSRLRALNRALKTAVRGREGRRVRKQAARLAERLAVLERRRALLPRLEPMFSRWKAVHVPMAVTLTIIASIHIALALMTT